jgi:hypothetical protein
MCLHHIRSLSRLFKKLAKKKFRNFSIASFKHIVAAKLDSSFKLPLDKESERKLTCQRDKV